MKLTRRDFIKSNAVAAAAATAGIAVPEAVLAQAKGKDDGVRWDKGACRYCGTGCGVLVGTKDGRIVANGGRVLTVCATGADLPEARARAYAAVGKIDWPEGFCRRDIGWRAVEREKAGG